MEKPNNLINEKSPYLLQHAYNPVKWYTWGKEAFKKAADENKPIFLSIGYATCHWCHVMEKESFEDDEVAKILNDNYISIKVDREERPDVDSVYMNVAQIMTGRGGWPLTIIMTPNKKPFFAGTYIPKAGRFGMMGLMDLLLQVKGLWKDKKAELLSKADEVTSFIRKGSSFSQTTYNAQELFVRAFNELDNSFDNEFGGFGSAPKFPTTHRLLFLLRYWKRTGDQLALDMVEKSLKMMRLGGVYDHIGFGFHRYSTDKEWLVPHFEKMLYDQAMIAIAYIEAFQATQKKEYKETADEIFSYVLRDMTSPEGGFYSAEDADSEGVEGKFYVWSKKEIEKILKKDDVELFFEIFNLTKNGNFEDEATQKKTGENIPHLKQSLIDIASKREMVVDELIKKMEIIRNQLFEIREKRIHPLKDDKILTDWNGLMITALAKAARVFDEPLYLEKAENAMNFILTTMQQKDGRLLRRYRDGNTALISNLDDYASLIWGLLELYETSLKPYYLEKAIELNNITIKHFWDEENGAFFFTPDDGEELLVREKLIYDGAIPSGNSVSVLNLLRIGRLTSNPEYEEKADIIARTFAKQLQRIPYAYSFLLSALDFAVGPSFEIVLVGKEEDKLKNEMMTQLRNNYIPNKVLIFKDIDDFKDIEKLIPSLKDYKDKNGKSTAYVCQNFVCNRPTNDVQIMLNQLKEVEKEI